MERGNSMTGTAPKVEDRTFDPRIDISADAYHIAKCARDDAREASGRIVKHMWIIFVLLPVVFGILFAILRS
jgi:hypothetical protein